MNTERIRSVGMAIVVVAAVGLSASTLASSMSTDPADAVDIEWEALPLDDDSENDVMSAAQGVEDEYRDSANGAADGGSGGSDEQPPPQAGDAAPEDRQSGDEVGEQGGSAGEGDARADSAAQADQSAAQRSRDLAAAGWPRTLLLLLALLLTVVAVAYRYRERLRRAVGGGAESADAPLSPAPQNDVERAWVELVQRAGVDRPRRRTPRDCARLAVENGFDSGHVEVLRRTFEDVRYGSGSPTDEQRRLARETLDRLTGERQ